MEQVCSLADCGLLLYDWLWFNNGTLCYYTILIVDIHIHVYITYGCKLQLHGCLFYKWSMGALLERVYSSSVLHYYKKLRCSASKYSFIAEAAYALS